MEKIIGRYQIIEEIGKGGMATVYLAHDPSLKRDVAIKIIRTGKEQDHVFLKRFEMEAKILAKLSHPNIVSVIDYGSNEGCPYLVMEYVAGGTLSHAATGRVSYIQAAKLLAPIAHALAYIHQHKIIHRDIKPSNILITSNNVPMLSDFGIARLVETEETMDLTKAGAGIGTPNYMAPEQALNRDVDHRADIYSLGMVLYKLITGETPFQADTPYAVLMKQVSEALPSPKKFVPNLPDGIVKVIEKALAKNPKDRYQTMEAFAIMLDQLADGNAAAPERMFLIPKPVLLAGAFILTLSLMTGGFWLFNQSLEAMPAVTQSHAPGLTETIEQKTVILPAVAEQTTEPAPPPTATVAVVATSTLKLTEENQPATPTPSPIPVATADWKPVRWDFPANPPTITLENLTTIQPMVNVSQNNRAIQVFDITSDFQRMVVNESSGFLVFDFAKQRELAVQTGGEVQLLAFSPDAERVAAYTSSEMLEQWDLNSGLLVNSFFIGKTGTIAFEPDGNLIYAGSLDGMIRVWNLEDGRLVQTLAGHKSRVNTLIFSPGGNKLFSGSDDKVIRVWNTEQGNQETQFGLHSDVITSITLSSNGSIMASGAKDGVTHLSDPATGKILQSIRLNSPVSDLSFSPDHKILAITFTSGEVQLWNVERNTIIQTLPPAENKLSYFRFNASGTQILAVGNQQWFMYQAVP